MKMVGFLVALFMMALCVPAWAAGNPSVQDLLSGREQPRNLADYANLYYAKCVAAEKDPQLAEYVQTQCACTASNIPSTMTMDDMDLFMRPGIRSSYYYTRLMTLAYIPCLETSIHDFTFDACMTDYKTLKRSLKVCECIADGAAESARIAAGPQLPGYNGSGYDMTKITSRPFSFTIGSEPYSASTKYYTQRCVQSIEFGWGN
jgi:hypothetical protein